MIKLLNLLELRSEICATEGMNDSFNIFNVIRTAVRTEGGGVFLRSSLDSSQPCQDIRIVG